MYRKLNTIQWFPEKYVSANSGVSWYLCNQSIILIFIEYRSNYYIFFTHTAILTCNLWSSILLDLWLCFWITTQHPTNLKPHVLHLCYCLTKENAAWSGNILISILCGYLSFKICHGCQKSLNLWMHNNPLWWFKVCYMVLVLLLNNYIPPSSSFQGTGNLPVPDSASQTFIYNLHYSFCLLQVFTINITLKSIISHIK